MKKCTKCQNIKSLEEFYKDSRKKDGLKSWCKKCHQEDSKKREVKYNETRKRYREENREEYRQKKRNYYNKNKQLVLKSNAKWRQSVNGRLNTYITSAKKRNIDWLLTDKEFESFWGKNCHYCNDEINGIGIDRVNNNLPYTMDNTVSCCNTCNKMKNNLKLDEFLNHIKKIYNNIKNE